MIIDDVNMSSDSAEQDEELDHSIKEEFHLDARRRIDMMMEEKRLKHCLSDYLEDDDAKSGRKKGSSCYDDDLFTDDGSDGE